MHRQNLPENGGQTWPPLAGRSGEEGPAPMQGAGEERLRVPRRRKWAAQHVLNQAGFTHLHVGGRTVPCACKVDLNNVDLNYAFLVIDIPSRDRNKACRAIPAERKRIIGRAPMRSGNGGMAKPPASVPS